MLDNPCNDADILLSIVELNKQKLNILLQMQKEEEINGVDSSNYIQLIDIYTLICDVLHKKLIGLSPEKRQKLLSIMEDFNRNKFVTDHILQVTNLPEQKLVLVRTISDLGSSFFHLYPNHNNNRLSYLQKFFEQLGVVVKKDNSESELINTDLVNEYMVSDYSNMLLQVIEERISKTKDLEEKKQLLGLKYHCIFLLEALEYRMLITNFSLSNYPHLIDAITVETAGITIQEYLNEFDLIISSSLENMVEKYAYKIMQTKRSLNLVSKIYLQVFSSLLTDKDLLECLKTEKSFLIGLEDEVVKKIIEMNQILDQGEKADYSYQRKYPNI